LPAAQAPLSDAAQFTANARLPAWAYAHAALLAAERERLLRPAWQFIGHDAEIAAVADFLSGDLAGERVLVVRDERSRLRAFRNACRRRPHALVIARSGHFEGAIHCASHSLTYRLDGRLVDGDTPGDLNALELKQLGRLILVRAAGTAASLRLLPAFPVPAEGAASELDWSAFDRMLPAAVQQGPPQLEGRGIERGRAQLQQRHGFVEPDIFGPEQQPDDRSVGHADTSGPSSGA